jgi:hypothetical protein
MEKKFRARLSSANRYCRLCALGKNRKDLKLQSAVFGQSAKPFSEVLLAIVSAYPGFYEVMQNESLAGIPDHERGFKDVNKSKYNAGTYLRLVLHSIIDRDPKWPSSLKPFEQFVFFTNALKCPTSVNKESIPFKNSDIFTCSQNWLIPELEALQSEVPLLLAASQALTALLPKVEGGVYANRNRELFWRHHPVVVTFNPIEAERSHLRYPASFDLTKDDVKIPDRLELSKAFPGTLPWHFANDIKRIKNLVWNYAKSTGRV